MQSKRIMTTKELAEYIKLNEKTVIKMAQSGRIPGVKIGAQWRFHLESIDAFIQNDFIKSGDNDLDLIINTVADIVPLSRLIKEDLIDLDLKGKTVNEILSGLAGIASGAKLIPSENKLLSELKKREKMLSTAVGNGVAIPHPRHPNQELFKNTNIIFARSKKGVDFNAPDKKPVHIFFMTCAPSEFIHVRLLAMISKMLHRPGIVKILLNANNKNTVVQTILEFEREHIFPLKLKRQKLT